MKLIRYQIFEGRRELFHTLLVGIISLAACLFRLEDFPRYFIHDEIDYGFLAKKIIETGEGKIEGLRHPLFFESWGGVKYAIQVYATALSYLTFGISVFSTRLPSVIFATIRNIFFYKILVHMFGRRTFALFFAILFIFYPWNLYYSRIAFEHSSFLMLVVISFYFLQLLIEEKEEKFLWHKILSGFFLGLSLYSYTLAKIFIPLYLFALILFSGDTLWRRLRWLLPYLAALLITVVPYFMRTSSDGIYSDYAAKILLFNYIDNKLELVTTILKHYLYTYSGLIDLVEYSGLTSENRLVHYSVVGVPLIPYIYLPLILSGFLVAVARVLKQQKARTYLIYLFGFLTFPAASVMTIDSYMSHRLILGAFFTFMIVAFGADHLYQYIKQKGPPVARFLSLTIAAILGINLVYSTVTAFKNDDVLLLSRYPEANRSPSFAHHYVSLHKAIDEVFKHDFDHLYISEDLFPIYTPYPIHKELLWLYSFRSPLPKNMNFDDRVYDQKVVIFSNRKPLEVDVNSLVISEQEILDPNPKLIKTFFETKGEKKYSEIHIYKRGTKVTN